MENRAQPCDENRAQPCDVFISYRRKDGSATAGRLYDSLVRRGYRVFMDANLSAGQFDVQLEQRISECRDFLLVLTPDALDRCTDEGDWVRREVECAKKQEKNIISVIDERFSFPEKLPESLEFLYKQHGLKISHLLWSAYVDKLADMLISKPSKRVITIYDNRHRFAMIAAALLLLCALGAGILVYRQTHAGYPSSQADINLTSSLIAYMTQNLTQVDLAGSTYLKGLDLALQYVEGKSSDSAVDIQLDLSRRLKEINGYKASLTGLTEQQREQLMNSPFPAGDLDAFLPALTVILEAYCDTLTHIRDDMLDNAGLHDDYKTAYIQIMREMAALDAEILFYNLNESLLPVTNESALSELKADILPYLPFINAKRLTLTHDETALKGNVRAVLEQYNALDTELEEALEREADRGNLDLLLPLMDEFIRRAEARGRDVSSLIESRQRLLEKKQQLETAKQELLELQKQLEEVRQEAREKFKPLESDEQGILWGKGMRFLTINMPVEAAECFKLFKQNAADETDRLAGEAGLRFAENCTALELRGGVVVCLYEEGKPHQAVELGDIIYEVDGAVIRSYTEYKAAVETEGVHDIRLIRFNATGYELLESVIDSSLGRLGLRGLNDDPQ